MRANHIIITFASMLGILVIASSLLTAAAPPVSNGNFHDSYGVKNHGMRGCYEFLSETGSSTSRSFIPPHLSLQRSPESTLVLWHPDIYWLSLESSTLKQLSSTLSQHGNLVVGLPFNWVSAINPDFSKALSSSSFIEDNRTSGAQNSSESKPNTSIHQFNSTVHQAITFVPRSLGIDNLSTSIFYFSDNSTFKGATFSPSSTDSMRLLAPLWRWEQRLRQFRRVSLVAQGYFKTLSTPANTLAIPYNEIQTINFNSTLGSESKPQLIRTGLLSFIDNEGDEHIIAASYKTGNGHCIIVSDSSLFTNTLLDKADNAALCYSIFTAHNSTSIIYDEFFNGHSVRGNSFWLFTQSPYGQIALAILLCILVIIWRSSPRLGPALDPRPVNRRTIEEYVDAMASLLFRGDCHSYLLIRIKEGVVWALRRRLHLSLRGETPEAVHAALARKDTSSARQFYDGIQRIDSLIGQDSQPTESQMTDAAREISSCL